jgi:hypothetical protein
VTRKALDRLYLIGYSALLAGTVLISVSSLIGGILFFGSIGLIILSAGLYIHNRK